MSNTVTLGGNAVQVEGNFPQKGQAAPSFTLVAKDLADTPLASFAGKRKVLNIFLSIDTQRHERWVVRAQHAAVARGAVPIVVTDRLPCSLDVTVP